MLVVAAWFAVAATVVGSTVRQGALLERIAGDRARRRSLQREAAAGTLLRALLAGGGTFLPSHYEFRLFLLDEAEQRLLPAFEGGGLEVADGWAIGKGVTGRAWQINSYVGATGSDVHDGTYGLTPEQQERYADLEAVAAVPVQDVRGEVIAVLSASTTHDDYGLTSPENRLEHVKLATVVARVLIDIARIADD